MRQLSQIESAYTEINVAYPFTLVCVLKMKIGPSLQALRQGLDQLQTIHPLLSVCIRRKIKRYWFEKDENTKPIPLEHVFRTSEDHWQSVAQKELNKGFNHTTSPLMRATYLSSKNTGGKSEIIFSFHHAIIDAASLIPLLQRLLLISSKNEAEQSKFYSKHSSKISLAPSLKKLLPSEFKGLSLLYQLFPFMYRQLKDERIYIESGKTVKDSPIPSSSENDIITISFSKEETTDLVKWTRRNKLTMNNTITAVMLEVVNGQKYNDKKEMLRAVQFANLRPYLQMKTSEEKAGCFATMMRFNIALSKKGSIAEIATELGRLFSKSAKRGDKFLFALMANIVVKKTLKAHDDRLGAVALSYGGPVFLKERYGNMVVDGIHAFISNNCLGAELSGFGKICFGKLSIDLNYLLEETSREDGTIIAKEIKSRLIQLT